MSEMGVLSQDDLEKITDCARAIGYETTHYDVRGSVVLHVRKGAQFVYWNPLDPERSDCLDLLVKSNLKIDMFNVYDTRGCSDLVVRAYDTSRRGHINGRHDMLRRDQVTPAEFCRALVEAVSKFRRLADEKQAKINRHVEHIFNGARRAAQSQR